jgi:hypothetical protein
MALRTIRSGVKNHHENSVLQHLTDMVRNGGVLTENAFRCRERTGGVGMAVEIMPGPLYVKGISGNAYPIILDSVEEVIVPLNASANPLIATIVCFNNLNHKPEAYGEGKDVPQFVCITGAPSAHPVAPTDEDIQNLIGVINPFDRLCDVVVGSQVTAIVNEDIIDRRQRAYLKVSKNVVRTEGVGEVVLDANVADNFVVNMTGNIVLAQPEGMLVGDWIYLTLKQDSVGTRVVDFSAFTAMSADMSLSIGNGRISEFAIYRNLLGYQIYAAGKQF